MKQSEKNFLSPRQLSIRISAGIMILFLLIILGLIIKGFSDGIFTSVESLQQYISQFGIWAPMVLAVFQGTKVLVPVIPSALGYAAGTVLFGPRISFFCNYAGICAGSIAAFLLARKCGKPLMDEMFPQGKYAKLTEWASKSKSYTAVLIIAMIQPFLPDDFFCYLSGLSNMKCHKFFAVIIAVRPWIILGYCFVFSFIN